MHGVADFGMNTKEIYHKLSIEMGLEELGDRIGERAQIRESMYNATNRSISSQREIVDNWMTDRGADSASFIYKSSRWLGETASEIGAWWTIGGGLAIAGRGAQAARVSRQVDLMIPQQVQKKIFKFNPAAAAHMHDSSRRTPVYILDNIIKAPTAVTKDPRGLSKASMYYGQIWRNKKLYNVEVLYDKKVNMIEHFKYTEKAIGPLNKTIK